jgi:hypothetical protein
VFIFLNVDKEHKKEEKRNIPMEGHHNNNNNHIIDEIVQYAQIVIS